MESTCTHGIISTKQTKHEWMNLALFSTLCPTRCLVVRSAFMFIGVGARLSDQLLVEEVRLFRWAPIRIWTSRSFGITQAKNILTTTLRFSMITRQSLTCI